MADSTTALSPANAAAQSARTAQAAQTSKTTQATGQANPAISSDFQTFLEMLTVQMQNQDPLNPIDSADYAVQLATFSSVEQQVRTNDILSSVLASVSASGVTQLAGWVGMEARSTAPVQFDGAPLTLTPLIDRLADEAWLVAYDDDGKEMQRQKLDLVAGPVDWAGVDGTGAPMASGLYQFAVENFSGGKQISTSPVESHSEVIEAQIVNGTTMLVLEGGAVIAASDVLGLRNPG